MTTESLMRRRPLWGSAVVFLAINPRGVRGGLTVDGSRLRTATGETVRLRGVSHLGPESACTVFVGDDDARAATTLEEEEDTEGLLPAVVAESSSSSDAASDEAAALEAAGFRRRRRAETTESGPDDDDPQEDEDADAAAALASSTEEEDTASLEAFFFASRDVDGTASRNVLGGAMPDPIAVRAIKSWGNNAVRVPLNEHCWLGRNGAPYTKEAYRSAVREFVRLIVEDNAMYAILSLSRSAPGEELATSQAPMPNSDHTVEAWTSIADTFKDDAETVLFELFDAPYPGYGASSDDDWTCWLYAQCDEATGVDYDAVGVQGLLTAVRSAGATNVALVDGPDWGSDLSRWPDLRPVDPLHPPNVAAAWHPTAFLDRDSASCHGIFPTAVVSADASPASEATADSEDTTSDATSDAATPPLTPEECWRRDVEPVLEAGYPVVAVESLDAATATPGAAAKLWAWLEARNASMFASSWNLFSPEFPDGLVLDYYDARPSKGWGEAWYAALNSNGNNVNAVGTSSSSSSGRGRGPSSQAGSVVLPRPSIDSSDEGLVVPGASSSSSSSQDAASGLPNPLGLSSLADEGVGDDATVGIVSPLDDAELDDGAVDDESLSSPDDEDDVDERTAFADDAESELALVAETEPPEPAVNRVIALLVSLAALLGFGGYLFISVCVRQHKRASARSAAAAFGGGAKGVVGLASRLFDQKHSGVLAGGGPDAANGESRQPLRAWLELEEDDSLGLDFGDRGPELEDKQH